MESCSAACGLGEHIDKSQKASFSCTSQEDGDNPSGEPGVEQLPSRKLLCLGASCCSASRGCWQYTSSGADGGFPAR